MTITESLADIARELRRLQRTSPTVRHELPVWDAEARRFVQWQHATFPDVQLPREVMFYLHDADLRLKDPACREAQDRQLEAVVASLERGIVPASNGVSIKLQPRWLGVFVLVILAAILYVSGR